MLDFSDIPGQNAVKRHLAAAASSDRVSHAYMLTGEAGMGKGPIAETFAAMLLCENSRLHPCGTCHACRQVSALTHPDLIHVRHDKPNSISVEDIRLQVNGEAQVRPFSGKRRIFVVPEAEKMTVQAQNALLKTFEEPPEYVVILLLAEREEAFLETIRSRSVRLKLKPVPEEEIRRMLLKKGAPEEEARMAARFSRGVPGVAERLCGIAGQEEAAETFRAQQDCFSRVLSELPGAGTERLMAAEQEIRELDPGLKEWISYVRMYFRDVLLLKTDRGTIRGGSLIFDTQETALRRYAAEISMREAGRILKETDRLEDRLRANVNPELSLELLLEKIRRSR